ncbi:MAG: HD family hydrolase [Euryarchaeota archaeon]|nr:HD family hydrolase [Euryarchaeota archaeon]MCD6158637.1 HD family hydrolase [Euryarchaeota archaeon]
MMGYNRKILECYLALKEIPRIGWLQRGVLSPESVASHVWGTAFLTMILGEELQRKGYNLSVEKAIKMALVHDLHEGIIGDIPSQSISKRLKDELERQVIEDLFSEYPSLRDLVLEYLSQKTLESKLVRLADLLDMALQAGEYLKSGFSRVKDFSNVIEHIRSHELYEPLRDTIEYALSLRWERT